METYYRYRIYTECCKNMAEKVADLLEQVGVSNYTMRYCTGIYKGIREHAVIIEVLVKNCMTTELQGVCEILKVINEQESVLLTYEITNAEMIR